MRGDTEQTARGCEREGQRVSNGLTDTASSEIKREGANCPAHREKNREQKTGAGGSKSKLNLLSQA